MIRSAIATLVAGAALTTGVSLTPALPAAGTSTRETACARVWEALPPAMQDDILAALSLSGREQHRALLAVRYAALHGIYGERVERRAEALRHRRVLVYRTLPAQLKADIRAARALPYDEQRDAILAIRAAALQGAYGERVQRLAERRQRFVDGCPDEIGTYLADESDPLAS
jgi:hypothetical protein